MLPKVFASDTLRAGKIGVVERSFAATVAEPAEFLSGIDFARAPNLLGYAETAVEAGRPGRAPHRGPRSAVGLVVLRRRQSIAFTSDCDRWAAPWLGWDQFDRFWAEVARSVARKAVRRRDNIPWSVQ